MNGAPVYRLEFSYQSRYAVVEASLEALQGLARLLNNGELPAAPAAAAGTRIEVVIRAPRSRRRVRVRATSIDQLQADEKDAIKRRMLDGK